MFKRFMAAVLVVLMCMTTFASFAGSTGGNAGRSSGGSSGGATIRFVPKNGIVEGLAGPGAISETPAFEEKQDRPVTPGTWTHDVANNKWSFFVNGQQVMNDWILVTNQTTGQKQWYYFKDGVMVTGWQWILCADGLYRCYYLNPAHDASEGACALSCKTPDGYTVDATGAYMVENTVVTKKSL